jgi:signal transduction histidine kinase
MEILELINPRLACAAPARRRLTISDGSMMGRCAGELASMSEEQHEPEISDWPTGHGPLRLLMVDDSAFDAQLVAERLRRDGLRFGLERVSDAAGLHAALARATPDLVLADIELQGLSALGVLQELRAAHPEVPLIVVTGALSEDAAVAAIDEGAVDYVLKDRLGRLTQAVLLAVERARLLARLEMRNRHMARLSLQLVKAQEHERSNLARELHDELGQRLSVLNMLLYRARPNFNGDEAARLWSCIEDEMAALVAQVRSITMSLRPPALDYFGLERALAQLLARQLAGGPAYVFEYAVVPGRLPPPVEITAYRVVQESVTNILRHAGASRVVVELNGGAEGDEMEIIVRDNGRGFDARGWKRRLAGGESYGLAGMCERVQLMEGRFEVRSRPGHGTRVQAILPIRSANQTEGVQP